MALNNFDENPFDEEAFAEDLPVEPAKRSGRGGFLTVIVILGVVFLLALLVLLFLAPKYLASQRAENMEQAALINAANTATAMAAVSMANQQQTALALTAQALLPTAAPTKTPVKAVVANTPVIAGMGLSDAELATVAALQTQMAGQGTVAPTELPDAGFADEFGLPLMGGMAVLLLVIIVFSRKLRLSSR